VHYASLDGDLKHTFTFKGEAYCPYNERLYTLRKEAMANGLGHRFVQKFHAMKDGCGALLTLKHEAKRPAA